jgi:hypothetical protein
MSFHLNFVDLQDANENIHSQLSLHQLDPL